MLEELVLVEVLKQRCAMPNARWAAHDFLRVALKCIVIRLQSMRMCFILSNTNSLFLSLVAANGGDSPLSFRFAPMSNAHSRLWSYILLIMYYGQDKYLRFELKLMLNVRFMSVQSVMLQAKSTSSRFLSQPRLFWRLLYDSVVTFNVRRCCTLRVTETYHSFDT
jgi:hypothetical protein